MISEKERGSYDVKASFQLPEEGYVPRVQRQGNIQASEYRLDSGKTSFDPDDHDIEAYYEDNRDEYDDYDDAYDGFCELLTIVSISPETN